MGLMWVTLGIILITYFIYLVFSRPAPLPPPRTSKAPTLTKADVLPLVDAAAFMWMAMRSAERNRNHSAPDHLMKDVTHTGDESGRQDT